MLSSRPRGKEGSSSQLDAAQYDKAAIDGEPRPKGDMARPGVPIKEDGREGQPPGRPTMEPQ